MSSVIEVPDWTRPVSVMGRDSEGNPVTVLLDSLGRLICVLYGAITLSGPVDVTQVDSTREIQGADGVTLHTIAVDSEGRIIALIKGMYGSTPTNVAVDASGQMITVPRGQSGNYLLVDADGFMAALMKGLYAGTTLKTCAVDSEGRMIMIPTDPADVWGNAISMGNAELAAILSFAKRVDRRGNVLFLDGFEGGLGRWTISLSGTGAAGVLSVASCADGSYSLKLTGGSSASGYAAAYAELSYPIESKVGLEALFTLSGNVTSVEFYFACLDGTNLIRGRVRYNVADSSFEYYNTGGTWTDIASGITLYKGDTAYHSVKFVIDLATNKYVRAILDGVEYDIDTVSLYTTGNNNPAFMAVWIWAYSSAGNNGYSYIDNVIITQNEPANV